jgi:hypothetical protein
MEREVAGGFEYPVRKALLKIRALLFIVLSTFPMFAQPLTRANVADILGFEDSQNGRLSARWGAGNSPDIVADNQCWSQIESSYPQPSRKFLLSGSGTDPHGMFA